MIRREREGESVKEKRIEEARRRGGKKKTRKHEKK